MPVVFWPSLGQVAEQFVVVLTPPQETLQMPEQKI